jgi:hypothetical protein
VGLRGPCGPQLVLTGRTFPGAHNWPWGALPYRRVVVNRMRGGWQVGLQSADGVRRPEQMLVSTEEERRTVDGAWTAAETLSAGGHVADLGVIPNSDVDDPLPGGDQGRLQQVWHRLTAARVSVFTLVLAVLVGGAAGAGIMDRRQREDRRVADESAISLVMLTDPLTRSVHIADGKVLLQHQVTVVNTGPADVEVSELRGSQDGLTMRGAATPVLVKAGVAQPLNVDVTIDCAAGMPRQAVPVELAVRTQDGQTRQESRLVLFFTGGLFDVIGITCSGGSPMLRVTSIPSIPAS